MSRPAVSFLGRAVARARAHLEASDAMWLICRATRPRLQRWCMVCTLLLGEVSSLMPPPPSVRVPALRWLKQALWMTVAVSITAGNQLLLTRNARYSQDLSKISKYAFSASTVMTAVQPLVVLLNNLVNFTNMAPVVSGLYMPPLRFHFGYVVTLAVTVGLLLAKHLLFFFTQRKPLQNNLVEFLASFVTLGFDVQVVFLAMCAEDKLHDVNSRLSALSRSRPELRALVLETAARQYELTADQVQELGSFRTMGVPLACNAVRHRVKLVTDSYLVYRYVEHMSGVVHSGTVLAIFVQLVTGIGRICMCTMAGHCLYRESQRTEAVLGAVNTIGWPDREKLLVERLLRNSRRGVRWSMGGLASMDHSFLLSVIGSTATYLVVLMQYKDPPAETPTNSTMPIPPTR